MPLAEVQPPWHPSAKDSASHLGFLSHSIVLAEVFEEKKWHLVTFTKTDLFLLLNREITIKGAKGWGQHLWSKKLLTETWPSWSLWEGLL